MDIDMDLLISLVESRPALWDKTQECYNNRQSTFAAWREICAALHDDFETLSDKQKNEYGKEITKKWNNARDNWMKYHKKINEHKKSGSGTKHRRKYKYYDQMVFLNKIMTSHQTEIANTRGETISNAHYDQTVSQTDSESSKSVHMAASTKPTKKRKTEYSEVDQQMVTLIQSAENDDSKSICFFKSIAPIVDKYSDDDYVDFQYEVMKIMKNITRRNQGFMKHHDDEWPEEGN